MPDGMLFSLDPRKAGRSGGATRPLSRRATRFQRPAGPVDRICKRCGVDYVHVMNSGTGSKYCADCKKLAYGEAVHRHQPPRSAVGPCPGCASACRRRAGMWDLCDSCFASIPELMVMRLRTHHAPVAFVLNVARSPRCEICGRDVSVRRRDSRGRLRPSFALDHDHSCCQSGTSCGKCLRGLLCLNCNAAIGYLGDDPETVATAAHYLARSQTWGAHGPVGSGGEGAQGGSDRSPRCVGRLGWPG
jgi:hypothetical protein